MRAFLALAPNPGAQAVLCRYQRQLAQSSWARHVKWVAESNLHLTIRFLGELLPAVQSDLVGRLKAELSRNGAPGPLELELREPSWFPSVRQPRILVCLVSETPPLTALATLAEESARKAGLAPEGKPFRAHITLGRTRPTLPTCPRLEIAPAQTRFWADALILYQSTLTPAGPIYTERQRFPLAEPH
ncbi:MAG: RNA 2',3'-cyclic phosphodiesterase [Acidobacteriota bacterium]